MTTWMTPVGVALIVGGITTLIVFRAALFRSARRDKRAAEARRGAGPDGEARTPGRRTGGTDDSGAGRQGRRAARAVEAPAAHAAVVGGAKPAKRSTAGSRTKSVSGKGAAGRLSGDGPDGDAEPGAARSEFDPAVSGGARPGYGRSAEFVGAGSRALVRPAVAQPVPMEVPEPRPNRRTRRAAVRPASLPHLGEPLDVEASTAPSGPVARRFWPTIGVPAPEPDPVSRFEAAPEPVTDRSARSLLHRLIDLEDDDSLPAPAGAAPTDVRLLALGLPDDGVPADDPGEPADQGGDPELDIDQDLDRAAEPGGEDERSRALDLPGVDHGYVADREADLSGHFDAVAGSDGTGAFSGLFADVSLADADETGLVPAAETDWAEPADPRYGDRVEGWVRPQYQDEPEPAAGEYWTPVPAGSYETEYGWPTPVERLPEVPPYPPATGFDVPVAVEAEPTAAVPLWPPARPDDRIELPRSWSHRSETGPAFRTPVDRDRPVALRPVADLPAETGRFGSEAAYQEENPAGRRRFDEAPPAADDRGFLGEQGLVLAPNPYVNEDEQGLVLAPDPYADEDAPGSPAAARPDEPAALPQRVRAKAGRVPARRGPRADGPFAAREESLEGPIWTVPDLPEAAMPDLTWSPEEDGRRPRRPAVMMRRRRGSAPAGALAGEDATQALPPLELDQQRARPRPRPRPGNGQPESRSTVYVSRHAAEPS